MIIQVLFIMWNLIWNTSTPFTGNTVLWEQGSLQVKVDVTPIGGFRGAAGAVMIAHCQGKVFTAFTSTELQELANVIGIVQNIYARNNIYNVLTFARQEKGKLYLCLIPYPRCNWIEKLQGLYHVIFGGKVLSKTEVKEIKTFFKKAFLDSSPCETRALPEPYGNDPFCNSALIESQKITDITIDKSLYHLLHDNRPKGVSITDPHLLIIPSKKAGHIYSPGETQIQRFQMLLIAQVAMRIFLEQEKYPILLYLKRDGKELQGVQHCHSHVQGIRDYPINFFDLVYAFWRQLFPSALSIQEIEAKTSHYRTYRRRFESIQG